MKKTKRIIKLICGAGNENFEEIEKLTFIFALSGFNMIDTALNRKAVEAVKRGIKKAGKEDAVSVCVSIGLKDDIHLSKAVIDEKKCTKCGVCLKTCERNAVLERNEQFYVDEKKCIGCEKCVKTCVCGAISKQNSKKTMQEAVKTLTSVCVDCIEYHCTSENEKLILEGFNELKTIKNVQYSICMNRSKMGDERIINILKQMTQDIDDIIIQADGKPMTGGINDYKSNIQTVSFAELIQSAGINAILILSGGTNSKTAEFAKLCGIKINGVAIGSFARKLVNEYITNENFWNDIDIQKKAILKAKQLFNQLEQNIL